MDLRKSAIAQGLKNLRLEKDYTQEYVGSILGGRDSSLVYRLESGKTDLKLGDAAKLADLYEVSIDYIYDPSKQRKPDIVSEPREPYYTRAKLQVSVLLDGTQLGLQRQLDMLHKVNAALAEQG